MGLTDEPIMRLPEREDPILNRSGEKIQEALTVSSTRNIQFSTTLNMEFRCIPVTPKLVADIGLIEDPQTRKILQDFVLGNTESVWSQQVVSDDVLSDMGLRDMAAVVQDHIVRQSVGKLTEEFENIFLGKARRFVEQGGL